MRSASIQVKRPRYHGKDLLHLPFTLIWIEWIGENEHGIEIIPWSDE
jgi:hypothetical protein